MESEVSLENMIGQPESETLEYKAVLPPARTMAKMIASFANNKGGYIVLGVAEESNRVEITGLSSDFYANDVVQKAIGLLSPHPLVSIENRVIQNKRLYIIKIEKAEAVVILGGNVFVREGDRTVLKNAIVKDFKSKAKVPFNLVIAKFDIYKSKSSGSKAKFIEHCTSILNIIDDVENLVFPVSFGSPTSISEGKILLRILFSSCADNFESYLSDLLYEIYLANPSTLKGDKQVSLKEVLDCTDMQEFIDYYARKKLSKLQRGSVKGFIAENQQISDLGVFDHALQNDVEKTLQIRHLYSHRNGIVDEKFMSFFPGQFNLNDEHILSTEELISKMIDLADTVDKLDQAAILKYSLATIR